MTYLVTGSHGFIGRHLIRRLLDLGHQVVGADVRPLDLRQIHESGFDRGNRPDLQVVDLRQLDETVRLVANVQPTKIFHLAADMGGIGYIGTVRARIACNNNRIDLGMLEAIRRCAPEAKMIYSSSACVYSAHTQASANVQPLKESDAMPADPEPGYGWEKLWMEQLCEYYREDYGLDVKCLRFHNCYGPWTAYDGGREKAPAAACRKLAQVEDGGTVTIWGDGQATRSFMYIDDCVDGLLKYMGSPSQETLNLGTSELVTVQQLFEMVRRISGKQVDFVYDTTKPQGVRGRNSDNTRLKAVLGWEPKISLYLGLRNLYPWVYQQVNTTRDPLLS